MAASVKEMLASANSSVPRINPEQARQLIEEGALLVDVRDAPELSAGGKLKGAVNVSRGMLEFRADDSTPYHNNQFRRERPVILYCASGGRSALSGKVLQDMGYEQVYNLGGFKDAADGGFPTEQA